jgi:hypothetical protein
MRAALDYLLSKRSDLFETLKQVDQALIDCERDHAHHAISILIKRREELDMMLNDFDHAISLLNEDHEKQLRQRQMKMVIEAQKRIFDRKSAERRANDPKHL